jgi:hypothetical protein
MSIGGGERLVSRRGFLGGVAAAAGVLGWRDAVALHADELGRAGRACILLWMGGGPSQFESFDPKPGTPTGGPTRASATDVPGVHIASDWERVAQSLQHLAVIRSMTHLEGEHDRATFQLHTGYTPSPAIAYPTLGSVVAREVAPAGLDLPSFVRIGSYQPGSGPGFLGAALAPFNVPSPLQLPRNVVLPAGIHAERLRRRLGLMNELGEDFARAGAAPLVAAHRQLSDRAARMVLSPDLEAFAVEREPAALRDRYGRNPFGQGCLLARRLIERGVTFVEVVSGHPEAPAGWDTHIDNFNVTRQLVSWVDPALATLLADLRQRGRLERTLVIWMGEFGRTPRINDRGVSGGRDHYPRAFSVALAGAGIQGGRVVGATDASGSEVRERPVRVPDLFATFLHALGIDPRKRYHAPGDVPVRLADNGEPIRELFA